MTPTRLEWKGESKKKGHSDVLRCPSSSLHRKYLNFQKKLTVPRSVRVFEVAALIPCPNDVFLLRLFEKQIIKLVFRFNVSCELADNKIL